MNFPITLNDQHHTLFLPTANVRVQVVVLHETWQRIHHHLAHAQPALQVLAELTAATALMAGSLKFNGSVILQLQGTGAIKLAVAECNDQLGLRATMKTHGDIQTGDHFQDLANPDGKALLAMMIDSNDRPAGTQPYQGIVALQADTIAGALADYMSQSEQIPTAFWFAQDGNHVVGMQLQRMPAEGGEPTAPQATTDAQEHDQDEPWHEVLALAHTIKAEEMLQCQPLDWLHRLFWQLEPSVLNSRTPHFQCRCSRDKVADVIRMLGESEVTSMLDEQPRVRIQCDYCSEAYFFDREECQRILAAT